MKSQPNLSRLVRNHRDLEACIANREGHFLSDWSCDNPFFEKLLGPRLFSAAASWSMSKNYIYFDDDLSLTKKICGFHRHDGLSLSPANVAAGPGSSSFLTTFSLLLRRRGYRKVHYLPPIYYTLHHLLQSLGIEAVPVSSKHAFEPDFAMHLPSHRTILLLCDPVWYAGVSVPANHIQAIADWQRTTKSVVFVDGSFQYMKWNDSRNEATALLDQTLTFRLVCPAKALAVPFFRFAYLLHPDEAHEELMLLYECTIGGANALDLAFAHRALEVLGDSSLSRTMPNFFRDTYDALIKREVIRTAIDPESGYFVFAVPAAHIPHQIVMDQSYFELSGYPGFCRINLMEAHRIYLKD